MSSLDGEAPQRQHHQQPSAKVAAKRIPWDELPVWLFPLILHCECRHTSGALLLFSFDFCSFLIVFSLLSVASKSNQACQCLPLYLYLFFTHTIYHHFAHCPIRCRMKRASHNWPSTIDIQVHSVRFYFLISEPVNWTHHVNNQDTINTMTYSDWQKCHSEQCLKHLLMIIRQQLSTNIWMPF